VAVRRSRSDMVLRRAASLATSKNPWHSVAAVR
jgi:hypothetical protein